MSGKVKGIYDALDHGQWKNAVKLCAALLKKEPGNVLCKALNAVALERLGRRDEALQLCGDARSGAEADETTLSTFFVVYRRCRQFSEVVQMYDAVLAKQPESEEIGVALFASAVRARDFAKAQQVAMKLNGKFKKQKYLAWVVVAIHLQAEHGAPLKVLDLAEMMLSKAPVSVEMAERKGPLNRTQQHLLLLHVSILQKKGKVTEAMDLLDRCTGFMPLSSDIPTMRIRLLGQAGDLQRATQEARALFLRNTGSWTAAQEYIALAFESAAPEGSLSKLRVELANGTSIDIEDHGARLHPRDGALPSLPTFADIESHASEDEVWNALLLFRHLREVPDQRDIRVPMLAEMELRRMTFCMNEASMGVLAAEAGIDPGPWRAAVAPGDFEDFASEVSSYFARFSTKNNCYFDLKPFLCLLDGIHIESILDSAKSDAVDTGGKAKEVSIGRLRRAFLRPESSEAAKAEVRQLVVGWRSSMGDERHSQEELLILAIVRLMDMDRAQCSDRASPCGGGTRQHLLDALALAEMGSAALPRCFHLRVLLVLLYGALGSIGPMMQWYLALEVKNIQHESISYLALDSLSAFGGHEALRDFCSRIREFHEDFDKDVGDALSLSFHSGVFQRVPEYVSSLDQLCRSVVWGRSILEETLSELGQAATSEACAECVGRQGAVLDQIASRPIDYWCVGNQDYATFNGFCPIPRASPLSSACFAAESWRRGPAGPTVLLQSARVRGVNSAASIWERAATPAAAKPSGEQSALEDLLLRGLEWSPARLKLSVSLLQALRALLRTGEPDAEALATALSGAREAMVIEGIETAVDAAAPAAGVPLGVPWRSVPQNFSMLCLRCAFLACELGQVVLRCSTAGEPWEQAEQRLVAIAESVKACFELLRGSAAEGRSPFALGHQGTAMLWALISGPAATAVPAVLWCCGSLPKGGGKKSKDKEGHEGLHATRQALRNLVVLLQATFSDIQAELASEDDVSVLTLSAEDASSSALHGLAELPELAAFHEQVAATMADSHRKHLTALRQAVGERVALMKTKAGFKA